MSGHNDEPLGVPPSEFHPHRPDAPIKKRGNVRKAILLGIVIVLVDLFIYFFLIAPDDSHLFKAIEPLKPQEAAPSMAKPSGIVLSGQAKVEALAKADLVRRLKVNESTIKVVSNEAVTWNDGSLGCPQPGMMYTQAVIEGTKVVLSAGQKKYDYHAGGNDEPILCEKKSQ